MMGGTGSRSARLPARSDAIAAGLAGPLITHHPSLIPNSDVIDPARLDSVLARYDEPNAEMSRPEVATDPQRMAALGRELAGLREVVTAVDAYRRLLRERDDLAELSRSETGEMAALAAAELEGVEARLPEVEAAGGNAMLP